MTLLTNTIDLRQRLQLMPAAAASINVKTFAEAQPPSQFEQGTRPKNTSYTDDGSWKMGSEVMILRWNHFLMSSCLSLLFFSSFVIGPVQMASARVVMT
jgi:hypothetical protein